MGKALIIKGADFSANAIGRVEPPKPNLWTDLRDGNYPISGLHKTFSANNNYKCSQVIPVDASERKEYMFRAPAGPANAKVLVAWLDSQERVLAGCNHDIANPIKAYPGEGNKYESNYVNEAYGPGGQYVVACMAVYVARPGFGNNLFSEYTDEQIAACTLKEVVTE